jgi:transcription elongation factor GreA
MRRSHFNIVGTSIFIFNHKIFFIMSVSYMTQEGYDKLKAELEDLKSRGRDEVAKAIAEAREKGDLSENAEYDAAKNAQGMLELKINDMEKVFAQARIIDESQLDTSRVTVLSNVTIENVKAKARVTYRLVAEAEADLKAKKISVKSPIGQALLGNAVGDTVDVETPAGKLQFKILEISL